MILNIFSVYLQPGDGVHTNETIIRLEKIVDRLLTQLPTSRILVVGDFNEKRADMQKALARHRLLPVLEEGTATHKAGGHLDQILTNTQLPWTFADVGLRTDHKSFVIDILIEKRDDDVSLDNMPTQVRQADIRKEVRKPEVIAKLLAEERVSEQPFMHKYGAAIKRSRVMEQWYQAPRGATHKGIQEEPSLEIKLKDERWRAEVKRAGDLWKSQDLAGFYKLVNRLTQMRPAAPIVKSIVKDDKEVVHAPREVLALIREDVERRQMELDVLFDNDQVFGFEVAAKAEY